jgi:D-alanyl-D-alanine carboxypeptidase/D-alanyl-D-alanine-endopeptidase (penicillin-binding protein 4)
VTRRVVSSSVIAPAPGAALRVGARLRAAAKRPQPGRDLLVGERLDHVVVGARIETGDPVGHRVPGREHQDRGVNPVAPQPAGDLDARYVGQPDVQDHDVQALDRRRQLQARLPVGGVLDDVAVLGEQAGQRASEPRVVLDQEQVHG